MPLEDAIPVIDDRRYDEILAELRTRIARYTPEWTPVWTDLNDSDPGITLAQLFAWLAEMLIFRMARVPELNYLKFLQLLGIELRPRQPALAEIAFGVEESHTKAAVTVPPRTQVSAEDPQGGPPVVFETERAIDALAVRLESVLAFDSYDFRDITTANTSTLAGYAPFGDLAPVDAALHLGFRYPAAWPGDRTAFPQADIDLAITVAQDSGAANTLQCGSAQTRAFASAQIAWDGWNGTAWQCLDLLRDDTLALTRSGHVLLKAPAPGTLRLGAAETNVTPDAFWIRARLASTSYERPPQLRTVRINTVAARQAETIRNEVLGGATGRRDQVLTLANTPVVEGSLALEIDEGSGFERWTEEPDLFGSGPGDRHFTLNPGTGEVRFGDGKNGAIPVANVDNADANIVAREYRFGGGSRANVPAGAIKTLMTAVAGIDAGAVTNLFAAYGGREEETLDEAKKRATRGVRARCRAVTAEDYEYFAGQAGNIRRAKALPLFHPAFPDVKVPGVVTVIVVPDSDAPAPMPSEGTLRTVCALLDERRTLTTELYVIAPTYQPVEVDGEIIVRDDADPAAVKKAIEEALSTYFHPLKGGDDGQGWPFGGTIHYSKLHQCVFSIDGVDRIDTLVVVLDGQKSEPCTNVPIRPNSLLYTTEHHLQVTYDQRAGDQA